MTALGKTLVFFNLLFSLVVGGLIVTVFVTRTNWKAGYDDVKKQAEAAVAARNAIDRQLTAERQKFESEKKELITQRDNFERRWNETKTELANMEQLRAAQSTTARVEQANSQSATTEITSLKNERDQMASQIAERNKLILDLEVAHKDFRNRAVAAEIARNATQQRLDKLMISYEHMVAQLNELRARGIVPPADAGSQAAPVEVRGRVADAFEDLASITLGSDHGLQVGNLLQVYRTTPTPTWVGTLQIIKTEPHKALGKFTPNGRNVIRKGDVVDSKILLK